MKKWTLRQAVRFDAGRHLPPPSGRSASLQGRAWNLVVEVDLDELSARGMGADFDAVADVVRKFDESCLQEMASLGALESVPTPERIIEVLAGLVARRLGRSCSVAVQASVEGGTTVTFRQ
jgi:6-pyruvoyl-tetrahydropterin synthase